MNISSSCIKAFGKAPEEKYDAQECSMCGDVGIEKELIRCQTCLHRLQHRYCSRLYPHTLMDDNKFICDWCLHERRSSCSSERNAGERFECSISTLQERNLEIKQSPENKNGRDVHSSENIETASETSVVNKCEAPAAQNCQRKKRAGKEKLTKHPRYKYKSLAKFL